MFNVSFFGLKENLEYGKQTIKEVRSEYPDGFKSNTYYETFTENYDPDKARELAQTIYKTRDRVDDFQRYGYSKKDAVANAVKEKGGANCGEQATLISRALDAKGLNNQIILMNKCRITPNSYLVTGGHTFCVLDMAENYELQNPDTWGEDAVVVDMWSNTVTKVKDAIEFFKTFVKPEGKEVIRYEKDTEF